MSRRSVILEQAKEKINVQESSNIVANDPTKKTFDGEGQVVNFTLGDKQELDKKKGRTGKRH
ncbi:MAG: hypothetical protein LBU35_03595 [Holosporales bacterium]|nr:hypothetical protein [Holosporales bacterium]